jgi:hypothetical protein
MLKKGILYVFVLMLFLLSSPSKVEAATVGDQLTSPENGWQRIDNKDLHFIYTGSWEDLSDSEHYNGSINCSTSLTSIKFKFYGTKFRILSDKNFNHSDNISIKIDGSEYTYSTLNKPHLKQMIAFEDKNLNLGIHTVEITNLKDGYYMNLDAVDIDATGYMTEYDTPTVDSKLKVVLEAEEKLQLSVDDHLDENTNMTWTSSDSTVAQVDANGVVTAIKAGNAVIHVQSPDGNYSDDINILVVDNADDYRLAIDLKVGKTSRLTVDDLTNILNVTWNSNDTTVATVSSKGVVTAKGKGLTLAKATDKDGKVVGQVYVRVRE